jgi:ATP-dependent DNA ligase
MLMRSPTRWARPKLVRPPGFILPCQPVLATKVPVGEGWLHELKHDGFRILAHKDGERVHLWSRNGRDRSRDFVAMADAVRALPASRIVLDGEAVAHCLDGLPGSSAATARRAPASTPSTCSGLRLRTFVASS